MIKASSLLALGWALNFHRQRFFAFSFTVNELSSTCPVCLLRRPWSLLVGWESESEMSTCLCLLRYLTINSSLLLLSCLRFFHWRSRCGRCACHACSQFEWCRGGDRVLIREKVIIVSTLTWIAVNPIFIRFEFLDWSSRIYLRFPIWYWHRLTLCYDSLRRIVFDFLLFLVSTSCSHQYLYSFPRYSCSWLDVRSVDDYVRIRSFDASLR